MQEFLISLYVLSIPCAFLVGLRKKQGIAMAILAMLFGPFGLLFAILYRGYKLRCPYCGEWILAKAVFCRWCQHSIDRN
jgi:hypothetical protein